MRTHLATLLDEFRSYDRAIAVVRHHGNRRRVTTYGEIARLAGRFAALLESQGIEPGDRVVIWAENSAEWIAAFHGCVLRGVLAVPLDAIGTAEFAGRVAADVRPKLVVGDAVLLAQLSEEWPRLPFEEWAEVLPATEAGPVEGLGPDTPLQILFTSGTTGDPKGIVLTHGNVLASVGPIERASQPYMKWERLIHPLRILHTLPLSHVFGQTMGLWVPQIYRAELHFESRLAAGRLIETIRKERISVLAAVPRVLALLKTHLEGTLPGLAERAAGPKGTATGVPVWLRWWRFRDVHGAFGLKFWALISGGGALPGPVEKFWNAVGLVVVQGYGMTETTALITLNHPFHVAKGTIGKPLAGREVKLGPDGEVLVRGASISKATWSGGRLHARADEWLATGDIAEKQDSGELRFLGRKSEVIVTAAGLNLHPEDLEAAVEQEPGVSACAVVAMETAAGTEPCAVLAFRGRGEQASAAMERANARLAEFQRLRRWILWPEPDLPRTSTGKVRRKAVAAWLKRIQAASSRVHGGASVEGGTGEFGASADWLLTLIGQISGETPPGVGDELRLSEDLHLDSLGRVQLAAALEERLGVASEGGLLDGVETLGELRRFLSDEPVEVGVEPRADVLRVAGGEVAGAAPARRYIYPKWPWLKPVAWVRTGFVEGVLRPLVWLLGNPRVVMEGQLEEGAPLLVVGNHVTAYDVPLIQYALPKRMRNRLAVAMSGEMLEDFRHWRNPELGPKHGKFALFGPAAYWLATALFNVFPLPRQRDFKPSFAHAGAAMDGGMNVLVFPEGARSAEGKLAPFRPGIGLLVKQSGAAVLPVAIRGVGELKAGRRRWFRSGEIEVRVGAVMRFEPGESEGAITARLQTAVARLLEEAILDGSGK